jgi:hypothetical protein
MDEMDRCEMTVGGQRARCGRSWPKSSRARSCACDCRAYLPSTADADAEFEQTIALQTDQPKRGAVACPTSCVSLLGPSRRPSSISR